MVNSLGFISNTQMVGVRVTQHTAPEPALTLTQDHPQPVLAKNKATKAKKKIVIKVKKPWKK